MESQNTKFDDSANKCTRTDTVFLPLSEINTGAVSLGLKDMSLNVKWWIANGWILPIGEAPSGGATLSCQKK